MVHSASVGQYNVADMHSPLESQSISSASVDMGLSGKLTPSHDEFPLHVNDPDPSIKDHITVI